ncbi:hypothetical protein [Absidia glauca]|uniref:Homeobox domain-containing protein n=1 Tax=Absidia glauca TaxID=4829 RepID=A0A163JSE2_ABSGL|nr:hypothetical protein [Absidia glauca]
MTTTQQQVLTEDMMTTVEPLSYSFENEYTIDDYCSTCSDDPHIIRPQSAKTENVSTSPSNHHQHYQSLVQKDFMPTFYNPFETKHRRRTSRAQFKVLESSFYENSKPNGTMRRWLAVKLGMTPRSVQVWFQNRRAKAKSQLKRKHSSNHASIDRAATGFEQLSSDIDSGTPLSLTTDYAPTMDHPNCCCYPSYPKEVPFMQWQQQQPPLSYDPLSVLMDQPDLMSWYSSSPISSPLPTLSSSSSSSPHHQLDLISSVNMSCSPSNTSTSSSFSSSSSSSSPPYYRRSSFPAHFDLLQASPKEEPLRRLSEPIFDLQQTPFMMMMDLQPLDPFQPPFL